jgi:SAM-dependent methyltransferase
LAEEGSGITEDDCAFYHTAVLDSGRVIEGAWDLRDRELDYLGGSDLQGHRILELGPASGYLTFHMEDLGAEVVGFDAGFDVPVDILPVDGVDAREARDSTMRYIARVQDSWWFLHDHYHSSAKMAYGNIYSLPGDLGTFDVAIFGCILLHLRDPWTAMAEAARRTAHRIIVTDLVQDTDEAPEGNVMRFAPLGPTEVTNWWAIYPGAVVAMLRRLGFSKTTVTCHSQRHRLGHDMTSPPVEMPLFTVVGDRD